MTFASPRGAGLDAVLALGQPLEAVPTLVVGEPGMPHELVLRSRGVLLEVAGADGFLPLVELEGVLLQRPAWASITPLKPSPRPPPAVASASRYLVG